MVRTSLAVALLMGAAPSCPDLFSLATHGFTAPTISVEQAQTQEAPGNALAVTVSIAAQNPNSFPIVVTGVDYLAKVDGAPVFAGSSDGVTVDEHGEAHLTLPGTVERNAPALQLLRAGDSAPYEVLGTVHVQTPAGAEADVEFSTSGTFVVPSNLTGVP